MDQQVALVTGASSGIGRATTEALASAGFTVAARVGMPPSPHRSTASRSSSST
ncbi:MAG: SDR family NAD(P)-dependent oxidoreductase [Nocardioides sp.]|nr:SDR family NAD(P)-dependent oxidoreductase [Nocardioides sp.]